MTNFALKYFNCKLEEPSDEFTEFFNKKIKAIDNPIFKEDQLCKFASYNSSLREKPLLTFSFIASQPKDN